MTWLSNTWNTLKNIGSKVGSFFGKAVPIIRTVGNAMSYLPGKIGQAISHYSEMIDSFNGFIPDSPLKNKLI
jgi:phage-related protein